ncbi:MAG TPA: hypothetical protein VN932_03260, partial [Rhizomicrobium sp.]|nr:hypothetical protein [Rhizomicrobium sp.]
MALRRGFGQALAAVAVALAVVAVFWPSLGESQTSSSGSGLGQVLQNVLNSQPGLQQILQGTGVPGTGAPTVVTPSVTSQQSTIPIAGSVPPTTTTMPQTGLALSGTAPPPATPSGPPQTHLEMIMSNRAGVPMSLFGYDQVGIGQAVTVPVIGAIPDSYI